jgi:N-acetyl sugar amidotransferase
MRNGEIIAMYGLPEQVKFCKKCVMSNQRPVSVPEFEHTIDQKKPTLAFDEEGVCDACRYAEIKDTQIDWDEREKQLRNLLDKYRRNDGYYDCIVPGSGGKDSGFAAHILKYKYGMHPLTITWAPHIYTEIGWKNFQNWINIGGFDNILFTPNGRVHRLLTKLAFENLLHPFQPFILGQKNLAPKIAVKYNIPLVFYGESEAEYGNPLVETKSALRDIRFYSNYKKNFSDIYLGGISIRDLIDKYGLNLNDLDVYLPVDVDKLEGAGIQIHYLGYYLKWIPQENYYYSVENTGFEANQERTEGTYSKYNSIDDRMDGLHYYTTYIKFGIGRATYEASQEIRNHHITREEGVRLVHRFDGGFPRRYFKEILEYMNMTEEAFWQIINKFRSPHLWEKIDGEWKLKYKVY